MSPQAFQGTPARESACRETGAVEVRPGGGASRSQSSRPLSRPQAPAPKDGAVSGTVTDTTGFVLPGVAVEAQATTGSGPERTVFTDRAGRFSIPALERGRRIKAP